MICLNDIKEEYSGEASFSLGDVEVNSTIERTETEDKNAWGKALSLSLSETEKYCNEKGDNCFIPSTALLTILYKDLINKKELSEEEKHTLKEINDYWHRTATIIVFPTKENKGYLVHYPEINNEGLVYEQGKVRGKVIIELENNEIPEYGEIALINDNKIFFQKILGIKKIEEFDKLFKEKNGFPLSLWIAPKECIENSPERIFIFGGIKQYGQGLWLTSYTKDKTLVGGRPFRIAYRK